MTHAPVLIGTAGWSIPKTAAELVPGGGTHLERYASVLRVVEINSSFHRPHRRSSYERWAAATPVTFRFSVKLPKAVSHVGKLVDADEAVAAFVAQIAGLGDRLAVVLVQLPPKLAFEDGVASAFFDLLRARLAAGVAVVCEPRHASWFGDEAEALFARHRVARVRADPVLAPGGERPGGWTGLRYFRLHGSPRVYFSAYDLSRLAEFADAILRDPGEAPCWCVFDNTASGAATTDALALRSLLAAS